MGRLLAASAAAALVLFAGNALAAQDFCAPDDPECDKSYGYKFTDDPLSANSYGIGGAVLKVRAGPVRRTLIRPRTNFVPEMLKSVEII